MSEIRDLDIVSIRDSLGSREAHNLYATGIADTVRPWFEDVEDAKVRRAIDLLNIPNRRAGAAEYLGLTIEVTDGDF